MSTQEQFELEVEVEENGFYKVNNKSGKKFANSKFQSGWQKYGNKMIIAAGIILVATISFEAGYLKGESVKDNGILINKIDFDKNITNPSEPVPTEEKQPATALAGGASISSQALKQNADLENTGLIDTKNCPYVASKNSNKYHLASCQFAAKIKPENKVCFSSAEEAKNRGYQGAKCCIK
jgi:hypothetical protein